VRAVSIAGLVAVCLALPAAAQARQKLPLLPTDLSLHHNLQVRPFQISYTGDGSGWLGGFDGTGRLNFGRMHWPRWNRTQAKGKGAVWLDDCVPDCADGTFHPYAVTVYATDPVANVFRHMTLRYRIHGRRVVDRRVVMHQGHGWTWGILGLP
jgi:hypothetical protein